MIKVVKEKITNLDKRIKKLMINGFKFSILVCFVSAVVLFTYELFYNSPDLYYIGLSIFKMGITFIAAFIACGFAFNEIKKEMG